MAQSDSQRVDTHSQYGAGDCGYKWLAQHAGISPCVRSWPSPPINNTVSLMDGTFFLKIENCAATTQACDPKDVEIWVGAHGPESVAKMAEPASDGTCSWAASFDFTQVGTYGLQVRLLN